MLMESSPQVRIYYMLRKLTVLGYEATTLEIVPRALTIYDKLRRPSIILC